MSAEQQATLARLLDSPVGGGLRVARDFLVDWYRLWRDESGQRRSLAEAWTQYEAWQANPTFKAIAPLRRVQENVGPERFRQLSHFLAHSNWEATNNGAERQGRAFRHFSSPHFTLRTISSIDATLRVRAELHKAAVLVPHVPLASRRRRRTEHDQTDQRAA